MDPTSLSLLAKESCSLINSVVGISRCSLVRPSMLISLKCEDRMFVVRSLTCWSFSVFQVRFELCWSAFDSFSRSFTSTRVTDWTICNRPMSVRSGSTMS